MARQRWWHRFLDAANREYERRIRAASQVVEYGQAHSHAAEPADDGEAAEIINLPRGARLRRPETPGSPEEV